MAVELKDVKQMLERLYNTISENICSPNVDKPTVNNIENILNKELEIVSNYYLTEENEYLAQMLLEAPPVVNNRRNKVETEIKDSVKLQKAESCRKSRMNHKIKSAKRKFRHDFVMDKFIKSRAIFTYMNDVIEQAENQLMKNGIVNRNSIQKLRTSLGMDNNVKNVELKPRTTDYNVIIVD